MKRKLTQTPHTKYTHVYTSNGHETYTAVHDEYMCIIIMITFSHLQKMLSQYIHMCKLLCAHICYYNLGQTRLDYSI